MVDDFFMVDCYILIRESSGHSCLKESDAVESVRGRLEESSSCPAKSDRRISKSFPGVVQAYVTKAGKKDSLPRKVAKSPPFSISIATEGGNIIIESKSRLESVRIKESNPQLVLGSRLLSFAESFHFWVHE